MASPTTSNSSNQTSNASSTSNLSSGTSQTTAPAGTVTVSPSASFLPGATICAVKECNVSEGLKACARCKIIFYCSKEHQRHSWPQHKLVCVKIENISESVNAMGLSINNGLATIEASKSTLSGSQILLDKIKRIENNESKFDILIKEAENQGNISAATKYKSAKKIDQNKQKNELIAQLDVQIEKDLKMCQDQLKEMQAIQKAAETCLKAL